MGKTDGSDSDNNLTGSNIREVLSQRIVGQDAVMQRIVPIVEIYLAGLAPDDRPAGIFLLLGPTGTGKTRTVEALAEVLHGSHRKLLKINCGEFQLDHEVAKLIGAPPGYTGHRETDGFLSQKNLEAVTTPACDLAIVLFDEIEKASPSLTALLLGLLDKASLRLGDGSEVNFERSLIFFTSNLGARQMMSEIRPELGFRQNTGAGQAELASRLERVCLAAVRQRFSPEFVNRIDAIITYHPLDSESLSAILDRQIVELQNHVNTRLGNKRFQIDVSDEGRAFLLEQGTSVEYGARELKRVVHRQLTQPLATYVVGGKIPAGSLVKIGLGASGDALTFSFEEPAVQAPADQPMILIVDDNVDLLNVLSETFQSRKMNARIITADCADTAINLIAAETPVVAFLDWLLPDGNGVTIGVHLKRKNPNTQIIIMSGAELIGEEKALCEEYGLQVLPKPFLAGQAVAMVKERRSSNRA
jgi:ATP-dependent Clp protease ATP-binding subunit ClpA/ActR/RegA family two-component response regulator